MNMKSSDRETIVSALSLLNSGKYTLDEAAVRLKINKHRLYYWVAQIRKAVGMDINYIRKTGGMKRDWSDIASEIKKHQK